MSSWDYGRLTAFLRESADALDVLAREHEDEDQELKSVYHTRLKIDQVQRTLKSAKRLLKAEAVNRR